MMLFFWLYFSPSPACRRYSLPAHLADHSAQLDARSAISAALSVHSADRSTISAHHAAQVDARSAIPASHAAHSADHAAHSADHAPHSADHAASRLGHTGHSTTTQKNG